MTLWDRFKDLVDNLRSIPNDAIIIVLVGPTGSGRSTFINKVVGSEKCDASSGVPGSLQPGQDTSLDPITKSFQRVRYEKDARTFVFIDTPGLDVETLHPLTFGKAAKLPNGRMVDGLIYLHRINLPRVTISPKDHEQLFQSLCGDGWAQKTVVATTMWSEGEDAKADERQKQIKDRCWNNVKLDTFNESGKDGWKIIDRCLTLSPP